MAAPAAHDAEPPTASNNRQQAAYIHDGWLKIVWGHEFVQLYVDKLQTKITRFDVSPHPSGDGSQIIKARCRVFPSEQAVNVPAMWRKQRGVEIPETPPTSPSVYGTPAEHPTTSARQAQAAGAKRQRQSRRSPHDNDIPQFAGTDDESPSGIAGSQGSNAGSGAQAPPDLDIGESQRDNDQSDQRDLGRGASDSRNDQFDIPALSEAAPPLDDEAIVSEPAPPPPEDEAVASETAPPVDEEVVSETAAPSDDGEDEEIINDLVPTFVDPMQRSAGLPQIGRTSYRTVCVQAIAHSRQMREYLAQLTGWTSRNRTVSAEHAQGLHVKNDKECFSCALSKLIDIIWTDVDARTAKKTMDNFHAVIQRNYERWAKGQKLDTAGDWQTSNNAQLDAATAMSWFLNTLNREQQALTPTRASGISFSTTIECTTTCGSNNCGAQHTEQQPETYVLKIEIPQGCTTLQAAMDANMDSQQAGPCSNSDSDHTQADQHSRKRIVEAPDFLAIHLREAGYSPLNTIQGFNLSWPTSNADFSAYTKAGSRAAVYDLIAVVSYTGDLAEEGHYIIQANGPGGAQWHEDNWGGPFWSGESQALPNSSDKLQDRKQNRAQVHMLIYERQQPPTVQQTTDGTTSAAQGSQENPSKKRKRDP
ncbi:MAG: hypothetical protein Q9162_001530 [Coniocarpon cinnabarinum]